MPAAVDLPPDLAAALETRLGAADPRSVARATAELSRRYRSPEPGAPVARSGTDVLAYAAYRLPATYAAACAAMAQVREQRPRWRPRTMLDLGAGPGGAAWAAARVWPSLEHVTAVETEPEMIELGRGLAALSGHDAVRAARWRRADLASAAELGEHDLVVLSYAAGELEPASLHDVVVRAWGAALGLVLAVEPGTPRGYATALAVRGALLAAGATTVGPCPHDGACPMGGGDWCHFAVRLPRTGAHRAAKAAALGYEDEKFSWAALARGTTARAPARILRHPQVRGGHVRLELCTPDGLRSRVVSRREGELYRLARRAQWGESFPHGDAATPFDSPSLLESGAPGADDGPRA